VPIFPLPHHLWPCCMIMAASVSDNELRKENGFRAHMGTEAVNQSFSSTGASRLQSLPVASRHPVRRRRRKRGPGHRCGHGRRGLGRGLGCRRCRIGQGLAVWQKCKLKAFRQSIVKQQVEP
jgi:hypothetical protein